ncbi:GNAT family N-acetyltransferase [Halobacillus amylolyticus]|uniref:GNAT family N-acetyltransferase n=1 Tax=Halobacillus amylolyticus TaxID=2932259 RepID=A0ABY4HCL9_9BACI|nr:GNAT family N-acetyltransferase [Halobacillus amylolyticus]UOR12561.1 GNAT family N-acetyltransferase [Halobacillus amylolyticus]
MKIRSVIDTDYNVLSPLINEWWGGRQMSDMLPKLFFVHFNDTSFIAEQNGKIVGFLIGFLSQSNSEEAYIHFAGVDPRHRKHNIGRRLYQEFFSVVKQNNRRTVKCITSPVNRNSIAYHTKIGFEIETGDKVESSVQIHSHYDGPDQDRVLFIKHLM